MSVDRVSDARGVDGRDGRDTVHGAAHSDGRGLGHDDRGLGHDVDYGNARDDDSELGSVGRDRRAEAVPQLKES